MSDSSQATAQQLQFTGCDNGFLKNEKITIEGVINLTFSEFRGCCAVSIMFESAEACFMANEKLSWRYADPTYAPNTLNGTYERQKGFVIQGCYFKSMNYDE
ncbi:MULTISPECIES: hypothetical protein [Entomomonas]|uniref:Uncharacterized protein n=1 Tax=Entomomonas asaccharolytica TaxID=2785331 RepID=A0A974NI24_9GAMM|nr:MULTISPECIES: hypothetical protein [Entomomonas]QQP86874.1 hypothetical protein JHT90_06425 [Entomomonas asaccharolytica]UYZ83508.1 hypothetical protein MTZ49_13030 [Entomomonas sp. E2T0]